jgi:tetratricopeptide (TPR) repeat protein
MAVTAATNQIRCKRIIREAEGYLELGLPQHALDALDRMTDPGTFKGARLWLMGEALRSQERFAEAAEVLEQAIELSPSKIEVYLGLGWCYKRTNRLSEAIRALERARDADPDQAIVHYNLACYHSLASHKHDAIECLSRALILVPNYRDMISAESDFDPIRNDPDFQALTSIIV